MSKRWLVAEPIPDDFRKSFPEFDPVLLQLLYNRGVRTQEEMDVFLGPDWSRDTHDPFLFSQMREAVDRVFQALEAGQVITVHGDYDADGVCGSSVLVSTLRDISAQVGADPVRVNAYIPHREKEGYGMSIETVEHLKEHEKTSLIITVDCGISNKPAIDRGRELGIDTIVCDHHTMPEELPMAILIHPLVPGEPYPNKDLCGTGVAFKLASALITEAIKLGADFPDGYEKWLLDLVAIATVTDVMPLTGENRVLEKYGLLVLNKTKRVGLQKLVEVAGGEWGELDTTAIGFQIGPRINAAGRMNHANEALHLLIEEDESKALEMANHLHSTNQSRRTASDAMYKEALEQVGDPSGRKLIVAVQEGWPAGLVGLVAGKLSSQFHLPVFVVGKNEGKYVGSGRSIDGFDITAAMRAAGEFLDKFGGHPQACGFSVMGEEKFAKAVEVMTAFAQKEIADELLVPGLRIDAEVDLDQINWELFDQVQKMQPFGQGNPEPLLCARGAEVVSADVVGKEGAHLRLTAVSARGKICKMIGFRFGDMFDQLGPGKKVDVVFQVGVNEWNGRRDLQLKIEDIQLCQNT